MKHLEMHWPHEKSPWYGPRRDLFEGAIKVMASRGVKMKFDPKYVAEPDYCYSADKEFIRNKGEILCHGSMYGIGMPLAELAPKKQAPPPPPPVPLDPRVRLTPTPSQREKISILREAEEAIVKAGATSVAGKIFAGIWTSGRDVWLYNADAETKSVDTTIPDKALWMDVKELQLDFHSAMRAMSGNMNLDTAQRIERLLKIATDRPDLMPRLKKRWNDAERMKP
jgi:hypothetical protein